MSSILVPDCYQFIVGLSRTNCDCFDIPADAEESLSGLYIDELESLQFIQTIQNCNFADLWTQMERARQIAVTTFQADTNALLMKGFKLKRQNFSGSIGRAIINTAALNQTVGQYYGMRIFCENVKSGVLVLKNINTIFSQTDTITLYIYNNLGDLIDTLTLNTVANKQTKNVVNIELPTHSPYVENLEYYLLYQASANQAKNNDLKCACGSFKPIYDTMHPYTKKNQVDRAYMWSNWVMVGGYHTSTLPEFGTTSVPNIAGNNLYGLTIDVDIKCKISEVLCYESLDFESNNIAGAMAIAIQHKAAIILANWILGSGNLSRFTMVESEKLIEDINKWESTYKTMTNFISEQVDITINDCLACRDIYEMTMVGIAV
jgi:hypothetical protein